MKLLPWDDNAPPTFIGSGYIEIVNTTEMRFTLFGETEDVRRAIQALNAAKAHPYDNQKKFRLIAVDYDGIEWSCGWTTPRLKGVPMNGFPITGEICSICAETSGAFVSRTSGVELIIVEKLELPVRIHIVKKSFLDDNEVFWEVDSGQEVVPVLDGEVRFSYHPAKSHLSVNVATTEQLQHPYLENWLCEPLRILLGRPVYPRLVARNFGDQSARVWVRPSPSARPYGIAGLLFGKDPCSDSKTFWTLYGRLLAFIAVARGEDGHPNSEPHPLTRIYEEIAEASRGSRWVLCMTLASSVEGLVRLVFPDMKKTDRNVVNRLRRREMRGAVSDEMIHAWETIRHEVMHGHLTSPWGSESEDAMIMELAGLVHALTHHLLDREVPKLPSEPLTPQPRRP